MKKFLLTIAAFAAVSAINAETVTETWSCVDADGNLKAEYVANPDPSKMSVVTIETANLKGEQTSGPISGYIDGASTPLDANYDNGWQGLKMEANIEPHNGVTVFYAVPGKGNPVNLEKIKWEQVISDGEPTGTYRADWTDTYYNPDGSAGMPKNGTYIKLTPAFDGTLTTSHWVNKGRREMFVVKQSDMKAMPLVTEVKMSGYIANTFINPDAVEGDADYRILKYQDNILTEADRKLAEDPAATVDDQDRWSVAGTQNQVGWIYLTFDVKAGETYWLFSKSSQLGFGGYEYTYEASSEPITPPVVGDAVRVLPDFAEDAKTLPAGTVLVDNADLKAETVWEAKCGVNEANFTLVDPSLAAFTKWFELRVGTDPSAENPDGTKYTDGTCTPVILNVKANMTLSAFVRTGGNKTCVLFDKSTFTAVEGAVKSVVDETSTSNSFFVYTYTLEAGKEYVLTERGGTGRFYGFEYIVSGGGSSISEVAVDENAPVEYYNLQGIRVNNPENGLYIRRQGNKVTKVIL